MTVPCAIGLTPNTAVRRRLPANGGGTEYGASAQPRTRHVWASPGWWSPVAVRLTVLAAAAAMMGGIDSVIVADPDFEQVRRMRLHERRPGIGRYQIMGNDAPDDDWLVDRPAGTLEDAIAARDAGVLAQ